MDIFKNTNLKQLFILFFILILATILRLYTIGTRGLWVDEGCSFIISRHTPVEIIKTLSTKTNLPFYFLLLHYWMLINNSEAFLRLLSVIFGLSLIILIYYSGKKMLSEKAGLWAAFLLAISPFHVYYSQEARCYTLLPLLIICSVISLHNALNKEQLSSTIIFILSTTFSLYTHIYAFFFLPVYFIYILLNTFLTDFSQVKKDATEVAMKKTSNLMNKNSASLWKWIIIVLIPLILFSPYLPIFTKQLDASKEIDTWKNAHPKHAIFQTLQLFMIGGKPPDIRIIPLKEGIRFQSLIIIFFSIAFLSAFFKFKGTSLKAGLQLDINKTKIFLLIALFVPLLIPYIISLIRSPIYLVGRYTIIGLPIFFLLIAEGLSKIKKSDFIYLIIPFLLLLSISSLSKYYKSDRKSNEKIDALQIASRCKNGDYLITTGAKRPVIEYYLRRKNKKLIIYSFPGEIAKNPGFMGTKYDSIPEEIMKKDAEEIIEKIYQNLPEDKNLWVVISGHEINKSLILELQNNRRLILTEKKDNIVRYIRQNYKTYEKIDILLNTLNKNIKPCDTIIFSFLPDASIEHFLNRTTLKNKYFFISLENALINMNKPKYIFERVNSIVKDILKQTNEKCNIWILAYNCKEHENFLIRQLLMSGMIIKQKVFGDSKGQDLSLTKYYIKSHNEPAINNTRKYQPTTQPEPQPVTANELQGIAKIVHSRAREGDIFIYTNDAVDVLDIIKKNLKSSGVKIFKIESEKDISNIINEAKNYINKGANILLISSARDVVLNKNVKLELAKFGIKAVGITSSKAFPNRIGIVFKKL